MVWISESAGLSVLWPRRARRYGGVGWLERISLPPLAAIRKILRGGSDGT